MGRLLQMQNLGCLSCGMHAGEHQPILRPVSPAVAGLAGLSGGDGFKVPSLDTNTSKAGMVIGLLAVGALGLWYWKKMR